MTVLAIQNLRVSYQQTEVIHGFDLAIEEGEIVALFGPSGCGKTTVLKSVAGLLSQAQGELTIAGRTVLSNGVNVPTEKRKVGLIFQDYALFPHLTVAQNIAFGLTDLTKPEQQTKVMQMLNLIKLAEYADAYPSQLSGGQQQRVAIVRALACEPDILLFDEAFSNIDPQFRFELIADIRGLLKQQNIAALFVTHNQDEAFAFCDRIALVHEGKVAQLADAQTLFTQPSSKFVAEFLGEGLWLHANVIANDKLHTEFGEVDYRGQEDLSGRVGEAVEVYLRPHQMQLSAEANSQFVVTQERFVGDSYHAIVSDQSQEFTVKSQVSMGQQAVSIHINTVITKVF